MKPAFLLSFFLIFIFILTGCAPFSPTIKPTQVVQFPSQTILTATVTVVLTSTPTATATKTPVPTVTRTRLVTLDAKSVQETVQPRLQDPMNCANPCFWGITPGTTSMEEVSVFFSRLGFTPFTGTDPNSSRYLYTIGYESKIGRDSHITIYPSKGFVESITITPDISRQEEGSPREWIAYSPETLIKKYGQPSRVEFYLAWPGGGGSEIIMSMYFDESDLIAKYTGQNMLPSNNHSPRLCPLTAPFDYVRLWIGSNPQYPPLAGIPLEEAASLTMDQFTQLMLGDPTKACFTLNGDAFQ